MNDATWPPADSEATAPATTHRRPWPFSARRTAGAAGISALALAGIVIAASGAGAPADTSVAASIGDAASNATTIDLLPGDASTGDDSTLPGRGATVPRWTGRDSASSTATSTQEAATEATDSESTGLVLIDTVLGYDGAAAAGTGMILSSDGLVLTNNHVVEGSTEIAVTVAETGETYTATVLGTDAADDVALLQLEDASGLTTVTMDDDGVAVGDQVTAVGNAEGGGVLMAADGTVTGLDTTVTTAAEFTTESETLDGMIEFEADVVSGDSGGALLDDQGEVVAMTTAASTGYGDTVAMAIPIDDALAIAAQIQAGDETDGVELGYPAFLGVALARDGGVAVMPNGRLGIVEGADGATIAGVYANTPAADAGLAAGATVTGVDGTAVTSGDDLAAALAEHDPGDTVTLTWTDASGATQTGDVTLTQGPVA